MVLDSEMTDVITNDQSTSADEVTQLQGLENPTNTGMVGSRKVEGELSIEMNWYVNLYYLRFSFVVIFIDFRMANRNPFLQRATRRRGS
jgi:hypothetical protein